MTLDLNRRALIAGTLATAAAGRANAAAPVGAPAPWGATPSVRQLAWHKRERYGFVHFTLNTWTDKEWGYGDEDPKLFDPTAFDPDQIVAAAKSAGLTGLVLTAKHHDGFCLWPTKLTEHCIRNSPYKGGKGDIVREMGDACRRGGISYGLYLSPWDRNRADYGKPSYVDYFRAQLTDLCTNYGELFEVWFDGANGGDGYYGGAREARKIDAPKYYNWPSIIALVHKLQPMACTFDPLGADIRWVGNEDGHAGDPCWPTMPNHPYVQSEGNSGVRGASLWWPAETNTSIRPGWFYHADEDLQVKSPQRLMQFHDESVGRGTNMMLNLPPDRRGLIAEPDLASLKSFGDALRGSFKTDLAKGAVATASSVRGRQFAAANVLDGNRETYWSTPDAVKTPSLVLDLPPGRRFDLIRIREALDLGVRVTKFAIDVADAKGAWREVAMHECIGAQRIIRLPEPVTARRVRLRIVEAPACPAITELSLFLSVAPVAIAASQATGNKIISKTGWTIVSAIQHTLAMKAGKPDFAGEKSLAGVVKPGLPGAEAVLDDDLATVWTTPAPTPTSIVMLMIDMGKAEQVAGFSLTPTRQALPDAGPPGRYRVETSEDGKTWTPADEGEFGNIAYARATQRITFAKARQARYLMLGFTTVATAQPKMAIAGIGAFRP
jgi:alpha-L-fucosidase